MSLSKNIPTNYSWVGFTKAKEMPKGWGKEVHIANYLFEDIKGGYCGKFLDYAKKGATSSMHFHRLKHETFFVHSGEFEFYHIDTRAADKEMRVLKKRDIVTIPPLCPHQIICRKPGFIIEFSTTDYADDNYRVAKGDSQK